MDFNHIKKVANSLSKLIDDSEKIALPVFVAKLNKASEAHPEDQTIGQMADITSRMASGKKLFITRAEIKELYNKLYSRNTKFAEIFKNELGQVEKLAEPTKYSRENDDSGLNMLNAAYDAVVDPALANALNSAFGNKSKGYTDTIADAAKAIAVKACQTSSVDVVSGNEDFILVRASYETPKGKTSVFVPVEVVAGKVLIPSVFIGNSGSKDLSKKSLVDYVVANAGSKLNITEDVVFAAIKGMKSKVSEISDVDIALTKLHAQKETKAEYVGGNSILFQKVANEDKNLVVKTPGYKDGEVESFAKAFDTSSGVAAFGFGKEVVNIGKVVISNKLAAIGLKDYQISVYGSDDKQIVYAVSLNAGRVAFRVPVKVANGKVLNPEILISNAAIESFSKEGLENLFRKESTDYAVSAVASALYGLKASELVQTVRDAMVEKNFAKAEDALNILSQGTDDLAYKTAFELYTSGLGGVKVAEKSGCKMIVRNASSKHPLCGHTGLPLHKVYQDKNGNCMAEYRKGMSESYEGASFMNSKIFF
jgi:hypothetical protein